jgi:cytochrome c biogenesis protein CcmG/thiol:disulfide interchange protein DsbE
MRSGRLLLAVATALALALAGCGAGSGGATPGAAAQQRSLQGAPPALAAIHAQANQVLGGGAQAFTARLHALRGHPVLVNKWASWCAPCRVEFPVLQRTNAKLGKRVAFLGLDARDDDSAARRYLKQHPISYPNYSDPKEQVARTVRAPQGFPITDFFDASGKLVFQHAGPYTSDKALEADVRKFLHVST